MTERLWLVERDYNDKGLIELVYATPDGERVRRRARAPAALQQRGAAVTAAIDVDADTLDSIDDPDLQNRYAKEATRMAEQHDPDDAV
ncbi:hypothetical protein ACFQJD_16260 [Haloplanus sp. GCM10025708]|uniref:hypothetical protein n=1 Tax=Haloferacaceae TaxID=1644056 RepID=UPI003617FBBB